MLDRSETTKNGNEGSAICIAFVSTQLFVPEARRRLERATDDSRSAAPTGAGGSRIAIPGGSTTG